MNEQSYLTVTEVPGIRTHKRQLSAMLTRYHFARGLSAGKDVLEVACGAGIGLGYIAKDARRVVGSDIDEQLLAFARETYKGNPKVEIRQCDAQSLPFDDKSFDVVLLYEAIYYIPDANKFFAEARRVLRPGGSLIIVTVNREWCGFNPSPHSIRYFSAKELIESLLPFGFDSQVFLAFPERSDSFKSKIVGSIRKVVVKLHLIPKTMRGKELLKRIFYGKLKALGRELTDDFAAIEPLKQITVGNEPIGDFEVIYVLGKVS
jgi:ubiquinone/menaquinone biosynthesis C-methylase UbiE